MKSVERILFAVKDPDSRRLAGIGNAAVLARKLGASLELFHAISTPVFLDVQPLTGTSLAELKREALGQRQRRLEKLAALARKRGAQVSCRVEWDFPPHEAIVRRAARVGADLIVAECHKGPRTRPWLMHLTDWELLRSSTVPILLLKGGTSAKRGKVVLAAVDPSHAHAKPLQLDADIVAAGEIMSRALGGKLHVMHANSPGYLGMALGDPSIDAGVLAATYDELRKKRRIDFEKFAGSAGIPPARRQLVDGTPIESIPRTARRLRAGLVVMGAVSRSGLKRLFIGNTAERVLAELPCDVLVVHPRRSVTRVEAKPRGMRVVAPSPLMPMPV
jgi:universal stress protein E